jgi:hypothetical protein
MKVLLIRHAESKFNKAVVDAHAHVDVGSTNKNLVFYVKIIKDPELIDAGITDYGVTQCQASVIKNAEVLRKVRLVLVSPMNRALETADWMFNKMLPTASGDHLPPYHKPAFVVMPDLHEVLESCCDVPMETPKKIHRFEGFDFTAQLGIEKKFGFLWFSETMFHQGIRKQIRNEVSKSSEGTDFEKACRTVDVIRDRLPNYLEAGPDVFYRTRRFRNWFWLYLKDKHYHDGEIAIVGHSFFFEVLSSTEFSADNHPTNGKHMENCEVAPFEMDPHEL